MEFTEITDLQTQRLLLRKLNLQDVPNYYSRLFGSPRVTKHLLSDTHRDISESAAAVEKVLARYEAGNCYRWGIALRQDNSLIGIIELLRFDSTDNTCSFAYLLGEDFWNQGYGTEALKAVFRFAFTQLQVSAILADHFVENPASGAVMRKAGMQYLGIAPGKYQKHGIPRDAAEYRITKEEWETKTRC